MKLSESQIKQVVQDYRTKGFAVIEDFLTSQEVDELRNEINNYVQEEAARLNPDGRVTVGEIWEHPDKNEYYAACADGQVRLFYEPYAVDKKEGRLTVKPEKGICKMGYALHNHKPAIMNFIRSPKIVELFKALDFEDPTLIQTMINFKNPKIGAEFLPHQDAQYLTTSEPGNLIGFWFALDDATAQNGCVDVIPGSNKWALVRRYVKCPGGKKADGTIFEWTAKRPIYAEKSYVKIETKKGALVLINGLLVHKSGPNNTDKSRMAFVFHAFDKSSCSYAADGWLPADCKAFAPIYTTK